MATLGTTAEHESKMCGAFLDVQQEGKCLGCSCAHEPEINNHHLAQSSCCMVHPLCPPCRVPCKSLEPPLIYSVCVSKMGKRSNLFKHAKAKKWSVKTYFLYDHGFLQHILNFLIIYLSSVQK